MNEGHFVTIGWHMLTVDTWAFKKKMHAKLAQNFLDWLCLKNNLFEKTPWLEA